MRSEPALTYWRCPECRAVVWIKLGAVCVGFTRIADIQPGPSDWTHAEALVEAHEARHERGGAA